MLLIKGEQCVCGLGGLHFTFSLISFNCLHPRMSLENMYNPKSCFFLKGSNIRAVDRTLLCMGNESRVV